MRRWVSKPSHLLNQCQRNCYTTNAIASIALKTTTNAIDVITSVIKVNVHFQIIFDRFPVLTFLSSNSIHQQRFQQITLLTAIAV